MLVNHTHERLPPSAFGMAKAFDDQLRQPDIAALTFEERLGTDDRSRGHRARQQAARRPAEVRRLAADRRHRGHRSAAPRGIERAFFAKLVDGDWIGRKQNLLITGPTGVGKSWIACALGHKACRDNRSVLYHRMPRLFEALALARGDGRYAGCSRRYRGSNSSSSTIGGWPRSPASSAAISSRSSTTAISAARPSSPARCRSITGTR